MRLIDTCTHVWVDKSMNELQKGYSTQGYLIYSVTSSYYVLGMKLSAQETLVSKTALCPAVVELLVSWGSRL